MTMNKYKAAGLAVTMLTIAAASAQDDGQAGPPPNPQNGITVIVNGRPVNFRSTAPQMVNGRVLVPLRGVFERLGAYVQWNAAQHEVVATRGRKNVELQIGNPNATVDGRQVTLDVPAEIIDGATMVPIRFVSESIGAEVRWREAEQTVIINSDQGRAEEIVVPQPVVVAGEPSRPHRMDMLRRDTIIPVVLDVDLGSNRSQPGDRFTASVRVGGTDLDGMLPRGTKISGEVVAVRPRHEGFPGALDLSFRRLTLPDGTSYAISGQAMFDREHPRNVNLRAGTEFGVRLMRDVPLRGR